MGGRGKHLMYLLDCTFFHEFMVFVFNLRDISYTEEGPRRERERGSDLFGGGLLSGVREGGKIQRRVSQLRQRACSLGPKMASVSGVGLELDLSSPGVGVRAGVGAGVWWGD